MNIKEVNVPKGYEVISIRFLRSEPTVFVLADNKFNKRVGLLSKDGGKTFKTQPHEFNLADRKKSRVRH